MVRQVEAIYEDGVLRPLEPLPLANAQRVRVTVTTSESERSTLDLELLERVKAEVASMRDVPSLAEVQRQLAVIPGSLTEDFIAERED
jgi:predicted DNA-binding antitoxin AbrB/MazE fold protein